MTNLSRNVAFNLVGQGILLLLSLISARFIFVRLGRDALGILYFALTLSNVLAALVELGVGATTVREVSVNYQSNPEYISKFVRTTSLFYWGGYLVLAALLNLFAPIVVTRWLHMASMDAPTATAVLRVLGSGALLVLPRSSYASMLRGVQRMEFNNGIDVTISAAQQFGLVLLLTLGGNVLQAAAWLSVCFTLGIVAYFIICLRFFSLRSLLPGYSHEVVLYNRKYSTKMTYLSLLSMISSQADKVAASKFLPIGVFGLYSFAWGLVSRIGFVTNAIGQAAFPVLSQLHGEERQESLVAHYNKLQDLVSYLLLPLFAMIPFVTLPLFGRLLEPSSARLLLVPSVLLAIGSYMNATITMLYFVSIAVGKPEIPARSNFYALFITLPTVVLLVKFFGINGAAFSWIVYHLWAYSYQVPRTCRECLGQRALSWYVHTGTIALLGCGTFGVVWCAIMLAGLQSALAFATGYAIAVATYALLAYFLMGTALRISLQQLGKLVHQRVTAA